MRNRIFFCSTVAQNLVTKRKRMCFGKFVFQTRIVTETIPFPDFFIKSAVDGKVIEPHMSFFELPSKAVHI